MGPLCPRTNAFLQDAEWTKYCCNEYIFSTCWTWAYITWGGKVQRCRQFQEKNKTFSSKKKRELDYYFRATETGLMRASFAGCTK